MHESLDRGRPRVQSELRPEELLWAFKRDFVRLIWVCRRVRLLLLQAALVLHDEYRWPHSPYYSKVVKSASRAMCFLSSKSVLKPILSSSSSKVKTGLAL